MTVESRRKTALAVSLLAVMSALASVDNVVVAFSTSGPDTYADGTVVVDGEVYALVWTPTGAMFGGVAADGTAVAPSELVLKATAKDGRCPNVQFQVDADFAAAHFPNGSWSVVMLDTRMFAVDPQTKVIDRTRVESVGGGFVNGYARVGEPTLSRTVVSLSPAGAVVAGDTRAVPAGAERLIITDFEVGGDFVRIAAKGSHPSLTYGIRSGDDAGRLTTDAESGERYGEADGELTFRVPKKAGVRFYGVVGH